MNKLYLVTRNKITNYDQFECKLVRAGSKEATRQLVADYDPDWATLWLDDKQSSCEIIGESGNAGVIVEGYVVTDE